MLSQTVISADLPIIAYSCSCIILIISYFRPRILILPQIKVSGVQRTCLSSLLLLKITVQFLQQPV